MKNQLSFKTLIMLSAILTNSLSILGADFGHANTLTESYFAFTADNEGSAVIVATPRNQDATLKVSKVSEDLIVIREIDPLPSISIPEPGPVVTLPGPGVVVTIPNSAVVGLVNNPQVPVVRFLVDRGIELRVERVDLRVTFPNPPGPGPKPRPRPRPLPLPAPKIN